MEIRVFKVCVDTFDLGQGSCVQEMIFWHDGTPWGHPTTHINFLPVELTAEEEANIPKDFLVFGPVYTRAHGMREVVVRFPRTTLSEQVKNISFVHMRPLSLAPPA